jgi:signal peptidase I
MSGEPRRPAAARIGLVLLNLLAPGAGLLRTHRPRLGAFFLLLPLAAIAVAVVLFASLPTLGFTGFALICAALLLAVAAAPIGSFVATWRHTRARFEGGGIWSRWWAVAVIVLLSIVATNLLVEAARGYYRTFYLPSESMDPTLLKGDDLVARMSGSGDLRRGDIVLVDREETSYIKRIAALPGDRFAMRGGIVILNGVPVPQQQVPSAGADGERLLIERFPGEAAPHRIADLGAEELDDFDEVTVRPGHVFVLGDNRDRSADSRVAYDMMGLDQVPLDRVRGKALFYWLFGKRGRTGQPIH